MPAQPSVLVHKPTKAIVKRGLYPREDMGEIVGLDPDYVWLVEYTQKFDESNITPPYDSRYFKLVTEVPDLTLYNFDLEHPDFPHVNPDPSLPSYPHLAMYKTSYSLAKRTTEEILVHVQEAKRLADEAIFKSQEQMTTTLRMLALMDKQQQGLTLTADEELELVKLRSMRVNVEKNQANHDQLVGLITAGSEPDIDAGWEKGL